jgi:hypothetical protein
MTDLHTMTIANLILRFATEIAGIAAVAYAAFQVDAAMPIRLVVASAAVVVLVVAWAALVAPRTDNGLAPRTKDVIGSVMLLVAAGALAAAGQPALGGSLAIAVALNTVLLVALGTEPRDRLASLGR